MGHELWAMNMEVFKAFSCFFFHGIFKAFSWLKTKKKPWDLPWKYFEKPVKMLWIYHEKFNRNFICFDFAVPACQDFDCSLPTLPSLFVLLNRVMGAWMPCMGAYGWVVGLFAMETVQWNLYSGRTPSGLRQVSPELRLGWGLLIINQQTKYYYFSRKRHLLL